MLPLLALPLLALASATQEPSELGWSDAAIRRLVSRVAAEALADDDAVGLSIAVGVGERIVFAGGYGLAELEHGVAAERDTLFRIGSVTKQLTAALVLQRVEEGRLDLDASIAEHLPELDLQGRTVTVRQLLNHTSGLPSYTDLGSEWLDKVSLDLTHEELFDLVEGKPFDFEPGEGWHYNNTGYYVLGMLLERLENPGGRVRIRDRYERLVRRELAEPLGLEHTRYGSNRQVIPGRAQGYAGLFALENDRLIAMGQPGAAGGLLSTARDLVVWQQALVGGRVVSAESYAQMIRPTVLPDGTDTGYGFGLRASEQDGVRTVGHGGGIFGFNSMLTYVPESRLHVAVLSNSEGCNSGEWARRLVAALTGAAPLEAPIEPDPDYASPRLGRLAAERRVDPGAVEEFWAEVEGETPWVEPGPDAEHAMVTFLWRDADARRVNLHGGRFVGTEKPLFRIPDTDVWYRTEVLSARARFTYAFQPDPPTREPRTMEELFESFEAHPPLSDPLQPRRFGERSTLELPGAPPQPWVAERDDVPRGELSAAEVGDWRVHLYTPPGYVAGQTPCDLLVLFDAGAYGAGWGADSPAPIPTPTILDNLLHEGRIGPVLGVLVDNGHGIERMARLGCSEPTASFLVDELVPWLRERHAIHDDPARVVVGGSSMGGLQAAFVGLRHPDVFGAVLAQSGSYWWTPEVEAAILGREPMASGWLIAEAARRPSRPGTIWMEVGRFEGAGAMVGSARHLRDVLRSKGWRVHYGEFEGGHDYLHWRGSLGDGIVALLGR